MSVDLAIEWAKAGHRVLPVNGQTKRPLIKAWQENCTTDEATIRVWWSQHPDARVGIATGEPGFDVLDFDVVDGKPGLEQLEKLLDAGVLVPGTFRVVATPSGGRHLYFRGSGQHNKQNDKRVPGVDFRGVGGMVVAAGNPGYRYVAGAGLDDLKPVEWDAVVRCLAPQEPAPVAPQQTPRASRLKSPLQPQVEHVPGEESPLDWYVRNHTFHEVLLADGWVWAYEHQGRQFYRRPGKQDEGVSANVWVNPDGRETLVNYSTSVGLPTDKGMSLAQYHAYTRHHGDMRAAAKQIRTGLMPRREPVKPTAPAGPPANPQGLGGMTAPPAAPVAPVGLPGAELVPAGEAGVPEPVRTFWQRRPELREVWWRAQISDTSPWAVLGTILAEIAGRVGPHVVLPPKGGVGAPASLNILVAVSGNSGEGKGVSSQVARQMMGHPRPPHRKPGTGQGIAAMFTEQTKEGPVQSNDTVVLSVAEITQLGAHMNQQGATITSTLLEVYMAEELGEHYANKELRRPVRDGAYRLALVAGVQPDNAGIIFDHAGSGLPQRFVWMPAFWADAVLPESGLVSPAPGWELPKWRAWSEILPGTLDDTLDATGWSPSDAASGLSSPNKGKGNKEPEAVAAPSKDPILVTYSPGVARTIDLDQRRRRNKIKSAQASGEDAAGDPDSHLLLTRIKVGVLLAVWLDGVTHLSDEMWELAGWVIWVSNDTRARAHGRIRAKAAEKAAGRAAASLTVKAIEKDAADREHNAVYIRACDRLLHIVTSAGDWIGGRAVSQKMNSREKKAMREAGIEVADVMGDLVQAGKLETREIERSNNTATEWRTK